MSGWTNVTSLKVQGEGSGSTLIASYAINFANTRGIPIEMTGIGFTGATVNLRGSVRSASIHHNAFTMTTFGDCITLTGDGGGNADHPYGVVFLNTFDGCRGLVYGDAGGLNENNSQHALWAQEQTIGSVGTADNGAVTFEGNTYNTDHFGNAVDSNTGGRYIFRWNTVNNSGAGSNEGFYLEAHSVQSIHRSAQRWEIYNNLLANTGGSIYYPFRLRGGTGVVFNNKITGTWTNYGIGLDNVRSISDASGTHNGANNAAALSNSTTNFTLTDCNVGGIIYNRTDGSKGTITGLDATTVTATISGGSENDWDSGDSYQCIRSSLATPGMCDGDSLWDSNEDSTGYLCRDQIGAGHDSTQWEDNPPGANTQTKDPAYAWGNTKGDGSSIGFEVIAGSDHLQLNRDLYNSQKVGYSSATCPHPLTGLTGSCDTATAGTSGYNVTTGSIRGVTSMGVSKK